MPEQRRHKRSRILWTCLVLHGPAILTIDAVIRDATNHGARVKLATQTPLLEPVHLLIANKNKLLRCTVEWTKDDEAGLEFAEEISLQDPSTPLQRVARRLWLERTAR